MSTLTGTGALTRLAVRRDRIMLAVWLYVFAAFIAATVVGFRGLYKTQASLASFAAGAGHNSAFLSLYGPLYGDSLGSVSAWRVSAVLSVVGSLFSIFVVIRHTRADEESGRLELTGSEPVGRHAALATGVLVAAIANLVIGAVLAVVALALGLPAGGSFLLGAGIACCGLAFTGVAAVTAQLSASARAARGLAIGALVVAFALRAVGDASSASGPRLLSWLSPVGWAVLDRAFGGGRWWVLALGILLAAALVIAGGVLAGRRDYDAGLLPQRPGPARASASLSSPLGLAWRLQSGTLYAWLAGALIYGLLIGSSARGIGGLLKSASTRKAVSDYGSGQGGLSEIYLAAILGFTGLVIAAYAVSAVLRLRSEESGGLAEPVLATGTGRLAWASAHVLIAAAGTAAMSLLAGLGTAVGYGALFGPLVWAGLALAPAALVLCGLAVALFGLVPSRSVAGSWTLFGLFALILFLGPLLRASHWLLDVSPFTHSPKLPGGTVSALPVVLLCLIALALTGAGLAGLRRRDIG
ncbi:MAG TPA: ABC transporter permease [Streptosporangiaceae bacterium]|nr:ABC transporter permease [Streptosporangiaceae bacterium]